MRDVGREAERPRVREAPRMEIHMPMPEARAPEVNVPMTEAEPWGMGRNRSMKQ